MQKTLGNESKMKQTKRERQSIKKFKEQEGECIYCDRKFTTYLNGGLDHVIPRHIIGTTHGSIINLVWCCTVCDQRKGGFSIFLEENEKPPWDISRLDEEFLHRVLVLQLYTGQKLRFFTGINLEPSA